MSKKKVKQGLSLVISLLLCVTSANFSMLASAAEPNAARIIGFNQLDESIASQNLPVGASIDDVIFPESIKATVETVEEIEVKKLIEKEKPDEAEDEKAFSTDEDDTDVETVDKAAEPEEKAEETTTDEAIVEEEPTEPEAEQPEEATAEETIESEPEALEDTEKEEAVDSSFIDILFPAMIVHAAEQEEEPSLVSGAMDVSSEPEYETVVEKKIVQSEITISDVKWKIENGAKFDSSKEASFVFRPVFNIDYIVNAETPTIKVNIVNTDSKTAFEKSQVVDGVRVLVKADVGVFPEGATLSVAKVSGQELQAVEEAVDEARADAKNKVESYTFDIKVLDKDGNEIEPDNSKGQVKVSFSLEEVADVNLDTDVYHVKGEVGDLSVDKLDAEEVAATTVEAVTDGFSFYTVEFTYNNLQYVMNGDTTVALSEILSAVGLEGEVSAATTDAPELFSVEDTANGWIVTAKQAFDTEQKLIVTINGAEYVIRVTDETSYRVFIGNTEVTSGNASNIFGDNKASFDAETRTLTLNGVNITENYYTTGGETYGIYYDGDKVLNINLTGTNIIGEGPSNSPNYGIYYFSIGTTEATRKLTISGDGTLNVHGGTAIQAYTGDVVISNGTVNAYAKADDGYGISAMQGILTISGGTVNVYPEGTGGSNQGFYSWQQLSLTGGNVNVESGTDENSNTVYFKKGIASGANVTIGTGVTSVVATGSVQAIYTSGMHYYNQVGGTGWTNVAGTEGIGSIGINASSTVYEKYKKVQFPANESALHTHNFTYRVAGATLTATCSNDNCPLTNSKISLILDSPKRPIYGSQEAVTAILTNLEDFTSATKLNVSQNNIKYYKVEGNKETEINGTPNSSGSYIAKLRISEFTLIKSFTLDYYYPLTSETDVTIENLNRESGAPAVGDVLKAHCDASDVTYQWYSGDEPIMGAIEDSYIVSAKDVGKTIYVKAIQTKQADGTPYSSNTPTKDSAPTATVIKAPATITSEEAQNAIIYAYDDEMISAETGYEFATSDEAEEGKIALSVSSIIDKTSSDDRVIFVRKVANEGYNASAWQAVTIKGRPAAPEGLDIAYASAQGSADGKILNTTTAMEYKTYDAKTYKAASKDVTLVKPGTYLVRTAATATAFASMTAVANVRVKTFPEAPIPEDFAVTNASTGNVDGKIGNVDTTMEYSADGGETWTKIDGNPLMPLAAGTYLIRYAENNIHFASEAVEVVVEEDPAKEPVDTGKISVTVNVKPGETRGIKVSIMRGSTEIVTKDLGILTLGTGKVIFDGLEVGNYNVVCSTYGGESESIDTKLLSVDKDTIVATSFEVLLGDVKTIVNVEKGTPEIAVDGLGDLLSDVEKLATANKEKAITVELNAEKKDESAATGIEDIKNIMTPGQSIDTVLDLSLFKNTKDLNTGEETKDNIGQNNNSVLEIAIPYDVADGKDVSIFRYHEDANGGKTTKQFSSLSSRLVAGLFEDAKFFFDRIKKYIYLYASDFSTYAIAISDSSETASASTSSGSGTDSSSGIKTVPVYRLFNPTNGYHFYTADAAEKDALVAAGWNDEGIAWQAGDQNGKPVYRLFDVNGNSGHIFTTSEEEKASYIAKGYRDEGIGWYAPSYAGRKVYKITNKTNGQVLYTISMDEKNALEAAGFICEEAGFVAY